MKIILRFMFVFILIISSNLMTIHSVMAKPLIKKNALISPSFLYGEWEVYRTQKVGGSAFTEQTLKAQIGKKITFKPHTMSWTPNTLFFDGKFCDNAQYKEQANTELENGQKGTLEYWGLKTEARGDFMGFDIICGNKPLTWIEITKNDEIAFYDDGYFFFCKHCRDTK